MTRHRAVIGAHHILMLYAHWAINDPRGSGSNQIRDPKFKSPLKEGLPRQHWEFVTPYDNWPFHKTR